MNSIVSNSIVSRIGWLFAPIIVCFSAIGSTEIHAAEERRLWIDIQGSLTVHARLIEVSETEVVLERDDEICVRQEIAEGHVQSSAGSTTAGAADRSLARSSNFKFGCIPRQCSR
jgi:hypothetical protein